MSFKLTKETDSHYIVTHPAGSFLKIAKKGLSPDLHSTIQKMSGGGKIQKMSGGGKFKNPNDNQMPNSWLANNISVGNSDDNQMPNSWLADNISVGNSDDPNIPNPMQSSSLYNALSGNDKNQSLESDSAAMVPDGGQSLPQSSQNPQQLQTPANSPQGAPSGANPYAESDLENQLKGLRGQAIQGSKELANAQGQEGKQSATQLQEGIDAQQKAIDSYAAAHTELKNHYNMIADEMNSGELDFNRVWHNMDTGHKLLAGIGMLMSGIGSGITNQPNLAHQIINETIERDIKSQMADKDNKKTAFAMYRQMFGDDMQAAQATNLGAQTIVATKLQQIAQNAREPIAQAEAKLKMIPIVQQLDQGISNLAIQRGQWNYETRGGQSATPQQQSSGPQNISQSAAQTGIQAGTQINSAGENTLATMGGNQQPQNPEESKIDEGETRQLDLQRLNGLRLLGKLPPEVLKQANDYTEAQTAKRNLKSAMLRMKDQILSHPNQVSTQQAKESIEELDFMGLHFPKTPPISAAGRQFEAAKAEADLTLNNHFSKRLSPEGLKRVGKMLPDREDAMNGPKEIDNKISHALKKIDETAPPDLLESMGLLK